MDFIKYISGICAKVRDTEKEIPVRLYMNQTGLKDVFGPSTDSPRRYVESVLSDPSVTKNFKGMDYCIAAIWGDVQARHKVMDLFGFGLGEEWLGDSDVSSWVIRNGIIVPANEFDSSDKKVVIASTEVLLNAEEAQRRECKNLEEYLASPPVLDIKEEERIIQ